MLFGNHLMDSTAFLSLEEIANALPPYSQTVIEVAAGNTFRNADDDLAEQIKKTINQYPKDKGLRSIMLNTLLRYPDHPFGFETTTQRCGIEKRANTQSSRSWPPQFSTTK